MSLERVFSLSYTFNCRSQPKKLLLLPWTELTQAARGCNRGHCFYASVWPCHYVLSFTSPPHTGGVFNGPTVVYLSGMSWHIQYFAEQHGRKFLTVFIICQRLFPPLLWFTIKTTTQLYYSLNVTAYLPTTIWLFKYVVLFCFSFPQSLDRAREQHFCKALARWSWSLFACKFSNPNSETSFWMPLRLCALSDSAELPNTVTQWEISD